MLHSMMLSLTIALLDTGAPVNVATMQKPSTDLPPCRTANIALAQPLDSKSAVEGQTFQFTVSEVDPPTGSEPEIASGSTGYGVVTVARSARTGGVPGTLVLETRFIVAPNGDHVPLAFAQPSSGYFEGRTNDAPRFLSLIPYVSLGSRSYNTFHRGGDVVIPPDYKVRVTIGDDAVMGGCQVYGKERPQSR